MTNKKKGVLLIVLPFIFLFVILSAWSILRFTAMQLSTGIEPAHERNTVLEPAELQLAESNMHTTIISMVNLVLSILGLVAVVAIPVGIIVGISFINKKEHLTDPAHQAQLAQNPQYKELTPDQTEYIHKWSWGAFWGVSIWALGNKLYLWAVGGVIPFVGLYVWIKLSMDGRKMAWEQGWDNFDQFKNRQKTMGIIIVVFFILYLMSQLVELYEL